MRRLKWDLIDWFKENKLLDSIEEYLVYSKSEILSKVGLRLWRMRMDW